MLRASDLIYLPDFPRARPAADVAQASGGCPHLRICSDEPHLVTNRLRKPRRCCEESFIYTGSPNSWEANRRSGSIPGIDIGASVYGGAAIMFGVTRAPSIPGPAGARAHSLFIAAGNLARVRGSNYTLRKLGAARLMAEGIHGVPVKMGAPSLRTRVVMHVPAPRRCEALGLPRVGRAGSLCLGHFRGGRGPRGEGPSPSSTALQSIWENLKRNLEYCEIGHI